LSNTTYYVRAYAINSSGTGYGSVVTFSTLSTNNQLDYLGQTPPGREFVRFAPNIIPEEMIHSITVSLDGQEIYWAERSGIKVTKIRDGHWTTPEFVSFSGNSGQDFYDDAPVVSPDNRKLLFNSRRPCSFNTSTGYNFWFSERTASGWSEPQPLPEVINATGGIHWQVSMSNSGSLYFGVASGDTIGIYYSRFVNGEYVTPEPLTIINNFGHVICPFIALDESYIIFNKIENGMPVGYYISFKGNDNQWLTPQRLNQFPGEESSFVTRDGRYIFCKAFWASAQIIEDLRPDSLNTNSVTDYEGNVYNTVKIGNQWWMAENLKTTHTSDGSILNGVYAYNNDENYVAEYGRLYTWQAALDAQIPGWHLPSDDEWNILESELGSEPGTKLKEGGSSGFEAKMAGFKNDDGGYSHLGSWTMFWSSTPYINNHIIVRNLFSDQTTIVSSGCDMRGANSVRYIKD
jgi:uncharacterized protein (TIGR02145 family)